MAIKLIADLRSVLLHLYIVDQGMDREVAQERVNSMLERELYAMARKEVRYELIKRLELQGKKNATALVNALSDASLFARYAKIPDSQPVTYRPDQGQPRPSLNVSEVLPHRRFRDEGIG